MNRLYLFRPLHPWKLLWFYFATFAIMPFALVWAAVKDLGWRPVAEAWSELCTQWSSWMRELGSMPRFFLYMHTKLWTGRDRWREDNEAELREIMRLRFPRRIDDAAQ